MSKKSAPKWERLCKVAERSMRAYQVSGVVLGVLHKGRVRSAGFGVTNLEHPLEVTDETLFQIGSITKTYTGTITMLLVESGQIDLDATVRTYLPEFRVRDEQASEKVTIRHLLTHTAGWFGDYFLDTGPGDDAGRRYVADMADLEQVTPLGQLVSYNNAGYYLLGHILEVITGKPYQQLLREMILEPLDLKSTYLDPGDVITHRFASGHVGTQVARPWQMPRAAFPVGGIICDVHDLLAYARFQMGDGTTASGERLLRQDSLARMQVPEATAFKDESRGLSWGILDAPAARLVMHGGGTNGQITQLILAPEKQFAVAVLTNAAAGGQVTLETSRAALKAYLDIDLSDPEPLEASPDQLAAYAGLYSQPMADIELGVLAGRLVGQRVAKMGFPDKDAPLSPPPPPMTVGVLGADRMMVLDGPMKSSKLDVIRREDGSIGWLRMGGRIYQAVR